MIVQGGHAEGWQDALVAAAELAAGERVLDVACGTGIVARHAARRVGPTGRVTTGWFAAWRIKSRSRAEPAPCSRPRHGEQPLRVA